MDQERERIEADLRGLIAGDVRCDDVFLQLYASDASLYELRPLGVVRPRGTADVVACVKYAADNNIPIHARGAGTGLAGESLGPGLVLDFSHSMRRILATRTDTVRVQPGVVHATLNRHLAASGRLFGPDPATRSVTTLGSVVALDGAGSHWLRYGSARRHVVSLQVVLADGSVIEANRHKIDDNSTDEANAPRRMLVKRLADLLQRSEPLIAEHQPKTLVNRSGYNLRGALENGELNLARLLVGSEGTLALVTEATLQTSPLPKHRGLAILFFDRLDSAARGAIEAGKLDVAACDLMDRRLLTLARDTDERYQALIPREAEAMLLVEQDADTEHELRERLDAVVKQLQHRTRLAFDSRTTTDRDERNLYWRITRRVVPTLYRLKGTARPLPFVEDLAVPPERLPDFLVTVQNVLKTHEVTASMFAHAGHGQLHIRPFMDLGKPEDLRKMQDLASDLYQEVLSVGGTISGEHGDGLSRTWFVRRQYGPLYDVLREVKRIFDPQNLFNPGKVVADVPQPLTKNLRPALAAVASGESQAAAGPAEESSVHGRIAPEGISNGKAAGGAEPELLADDVPAGNGKPPGAGLKFHLLWQSEDIAQAAKSCNGCGRCRTQSPDERMCPIFRFAPAEESSPRAKANLVRGILSGRLEASLLTGETLKDVADLCVNCHQCRLECPAGVDIPKLMAEFKAQYVADNGLRFGDWFLTRLDKFSRYAALIRPVTNWAFGNRVMRWLLEKTLGIAQGRKLPRIVPRSFLRRAARRRLTRPTRGEGRKVLYFVDLYANWYDAQLAEAFVAVMEHNGVSVYVHPGQYTSGMIMLTLGAADDARRLAAKNVSILAEAVRQGYQIVATEPSAALSLSHDYLNLLDDDDARLVAQNTSEACTYLWKLHRAGELKLDLSPVNTAIGYHLPCHLRALQTGSPGEDLLRLVPGLSVQRVEKGCSGMAGLFGVKRENYRSSLRAGWGLISALRDPAISVGATECSTCKLQMEQGTTKPTIHPLKILALSYGLMPELARPFLTARGEELIVT